MLVVLRVEPDPPRAHRNGGTGGLFLRSLPRGCGVEAGGSPGGTPQAPALRRGGGFRERLGVSSRGSSRLYLRLHGLSPSSSPPRVIGQEKIISGDRKKRE